MPSLLQFRVLQSVATFGELREAAIHLRRSVSAVSTNLKQLEDWAGGALFEGDRKSRLTVLGRFIVKETRPLLEHNDRVINAIRHYADGGPGHLHISCVPSVAAAFMPEVLATLWNTLPGLNVEVRDTDSRSVADSVALGTADIGIASTLGTGATDLAFEPLFTDPLDFVCPTDDPLCASGAPVSWADIGQRRFLGNGSYGTFASDGFNAIRERQAAHIPNVISLLSVVRAGLGVTVLPRLIRISATSGVVFVPLADTKARRTVYAIRREGRQPSRLAIRVLCLLHQIVTERQGDLGIEVLSLPQGTDRGFR